MANVAGTGGNDLITPGFVSPGVVGVPGAGNDSIGAAPGNDTVEGGAGADSIFGAEGLDSLFGGDGNDSIDGGFDGDVLYGEAGSDTLRGNIGNDLLIGGDNFSAPDELYGDGGNDSLFGEAGTDYLAGGAGADQLDGGAGDDWAYYRFATAGLVASLASPAQNTGDASGDSYFLVEGIWGSAFADRLAGNAGNNTLIGGDGADTLLGGAGADLFTGEDPFNPVFAFDWVSYEDSPTGLRVDMDEVGFNTGIAAGDDYSGIEGLIGSAGNDTLSATDFANQVQGGLGDDKLIGELGADTMLGGDGTDTASYERDGVGVLVDLRAFVFAGGHAAGDFLSEFENLEGGTGHDSLGGTDGANRLSGRGGDDYLAGYGGADTIEGEAGADRAEAGLGADSLSGGDGNDILGDNEQVVLLSGLGDAAADTLQGQAGADTLLAAAGEDVLVGGTGADSLLGGDGADVLSDHTQEVASPGGTLVAGGFAATEADTLLGGAGADWLYASGGGDQIDGGADLDTLVVDVSGQALGLTFVIAAGAPPWTISLGGVVTASVANVESLSITGSAVRDVMNATNLPSSATLDGGAGNDLLRGGASADTLIGSGGADQLFGNGGNDLLVGGAGRDTMTGGAGVDTFRWDVAAEANDSIAGFVSGTDRLQVDASGFKGGLTAGIDLLATGRFVAGAAPTAAKGQFLYDVGAGLLQWDRDGTGAATAVTIAQFGAGTVVAAGDFVVVA